MLVQCILADIVVVVDNSESKITMCLTLFLGSFVQITVD